jgi:hypothetical protein
VWHLTLQVRASVAYVVLPCPTLRSLTSIVHLDKLRFLSFPRGGGVPPGGYPPARTPASHPQ